MSGIYIQGMDKPHDENDSIHILRDGTAVVYRTGSIDFYKAIPVPDHGRLIDADEIPYKKIMLEDDEFYYGVTMPYIDRMPTIIPADKEGRPNEKQE